MKICQPHWNELRQGIDDLELGHLVAKDGDELMAIIESAHDGTYDDKTDFDPLLMANFLIWQNAIEAGGTYLLGTDADGEPFCPLCELEKNDGVASEWIGCACQDSLNEARRLGLASRVQ